MNKQLAAYLFSDETLYYKTTVEPKRDSNLQVAAVAKETVKPKITLDSNTLVLVDTLDEAQKAFLLKILASVKLSADKVSIVLESKADEYNLTTVKNVISFGDFSKKAGFKSNIHKYSHAIIDHKKILVADLLSTINTNNSDEKRLLWNALKQMFTID